MSPAVYLLEERIEGLNFTAGGNVIRDCSKEFLCRALICELDEYKPLMVLVEPGDVALDLIQWNSPAFSDT